VKFARVARTPALTVRGSSLGKSRRSRTRRSWRSRKIPSKSRAPDTSMAINASPAKKPLTARLALPALTGERERNQNHSPLTGGEGARRRRAGEGSRSTPLDFDGALDMVSENKSRKRYVSDIFHGSGRSTDWTGTVISLRTIDFQLLLIAS